jgi:predicted deacylase
MQTEQIALASPAPGVALALTVHRFGTPGARPRVYIQASLHADELPGMIAAHHLRERLTRLEAEGRIAGEIVLVPSANPIGLSQTLLGTPIGRFDFADGLNFNRAYPYLVPQVAEAVRDRLGADEDGNRRAIREALAAALAASPAVSPAEQLKKHLLGLAIEADVVLDLHCDSEAVMHLYTLTPHAEAFAPLSSLLGCHAVLVATESGADPFDEACSRPWHELAQQFPDRPIPAGCIACTVELRGERDVSHEHAAADAAAIVDYLTLLGAVAGPQPAVPAPLCEPTPLESSEPITASAAGILCFHAQPGDRVKAGDRIADIVDPLTGVVTPALTSSTGVLYARISGRFVGAGERIGKVAGTTFQRTGKLLSA